MKRLCAACGCIITTGSCITVINVQSSLHPLQSSNLDLLHFITLFSYIILFIFHSSDPVVLQICTTFRDQPQQAMFSMEMFSLCPRGGFIQRTEVFYYCHCFFFFCLNFIISDQSERGLIVRQKAQSSSHGSFRLGLGTGAALKQTLLSSFRYVSPHLI